MLRKILINFEIFLGIIKTIINWPSYILNYTGIIKEKKVFLRNGLKYIIRPGSADATILNEVWIKKLYTPKGFEIKENDIVIDVGAHIGIFSTFAAFYAKKGLVYSFEPLKENFYLLEKNVKINKLKNIKFFNKGLGKKQKFVKLYIFENKASNSTKIFENKNNYVLICLVELKKIIDKINKKINLLKIDCEGCEYEVLFNLPSSYFEKIDKIVLEFHDINKKYNYKTISAHLRKMNFKVIIVKNFYNMIYATKI